MRVWTEAIILDGRYLDVSFVDGSCNRESIMGPGFGFGDLGSLGMRPWRSILPMFPMVQCNGSVFWAPLGG